MTSSPYQAQRRQAVAARLTATCRRLTLERGLTGFTVDEACHEVGVSRRTFFNYFPSKEEAVLGVVEEEELERFAEQFLARRSRGWSAVVDDLIEFASHFANTAGLNAADYLEFMSVLGREPRLLARFIGLSRERDAALLHLVATREGVAIDDAHARASVDVIGAVMRSASDRLLDGHLAPQFVAEDFGVTLNRSLTAMREVLIDGKAAQ